jgi:hypothetical protein
MKSRSATTKQRKGLRKNFEIEILSLERTWLHSVRKKS